MRLCGLVSTPTDKEMIYAFTATFFVLLAVCAAVNASGNNYTIIPLTTELTELQRSKIIDGTCQFFYTDNDNADWGHVWKFYKNNPELRLHAVNYQWPATTAAEKSKSRKIEIFAIYFGNFLMENIDKEVLSFFMSPEASFVFNERFGQGFIKTSRFFYDDTISIDTSNMNFLMVAVLMYNLDVIDLVVKATLGTKLKLDVTFGKINVRCVARKIRKESERRVVLSKLRIDQSKHDLSGVNLVLKEDLTVNVKEAVIFNNLEMFESALLLGNFGDKNDSNIIKYAINNGNYLILEALVLEGYAIPNMTITDYKGMDEEDVNFILKEKSLERRVPLGRRRKWYGFSFYNEHCF